MTKGRYVPRLFRVTPPGRSGPSIWRRVLYPHSPFGLVSATHKRAQTVSGPPQSPTRSLKVSSNRSPDHLVQREEGYSQHGLRRSTAPDDVMRYKCSARPFGCPCQICDHQRLGLMRCGHSHPSAGLSSRVRLCLRWSLPPVEWFAFALQGEGRD